MHAVHDDVAREPIIVDATDLVADPEPQARFAGSAHRVVRYGLG